MSRIKKIYIIGFMGSGKTTAGKKLAASMGWPFVDIDETIQSNQKKTIAQIFSEKGEEYFRKLEVDALHNLEPADEIVISTGGGAPCYSDNLAFMKDTGVVIYLKMNAIQLMSRLKGSQGTRPLLKDLKGEDLHDYIEKKLAEREPFYNQADIIADGSEPDISSMVKKIISFSNTGNNKDISC